MDSSKSSSTAVNDDAAIAVFGTPAEATGEEDALVQAGAIVGSIALPMTMKAAIDLGILEIIAAAGKEAGITAAEVAAKLPVKENPNAADMVDRILRFLAVFSVVSRSVDDVAGDRVYGMTPVGRLFVKDGDGVSMSPLMNLLTDHVFCLISWYKLKDVVLEGGVPFNKVHGMSAFEYQSVDTRFNDVFNLAMFNETSISIKKILQSYKGFENINHLVDVGGGLGQVLQIILSNYPNMKGINFDLPHVIKNAISHPGMEHIGGDMFEAVPNTDAVFIKSILHDWGDEHCLKLLKNCHKATGDNGKVIVVESVVSEKPKMTAEAKVWSIKDMTMMTQNPGGKERTKEEFLVLAKASQFAGIRFQSVVSGH